MSSSTPPSSTANIINHLSQRSSSNSSSLINKYYALRHGQSLANVAKIISSDPAISTKQHGLSELGKEQVRIAGEAFATDYIESISNNNGDDTNDDNISQGVAIFSSDFLRATETATIFASILCKHEIPIYQNNIILETRLRERYFGELNGGPDTRYQEVWNEDVTDANHVKFGVESANSVLERTTRFIVELDDRLSMTLSSSESNEQGGTETDLEGRCNRRPWKVILVAHGDVLQILQTGFLLHGDASRHRSLDHLETATVRELTLPNIGVDPVPK
jgi:broad specificity phosphatase PhoE